MGVMCLYLDMVPLNYTLQNRLCVLSHLRSMLHTRTYDHTLHDLQDGLVLYTGVVVKSIQYSVVPAPV